MLSDLKKTKNKTNKQTNSITAKRIERWRGSDRRTGRRRGSAEWGGLGGVGWDGHDVGWEMREMRA